MNNNTWPVKIPSHAIQLFPILKQNEAIKCKFYVSAICFSQPEIPRFLSDEECEHIISLAKESGLAMSIAGSDKAAYEGNLDEDMAEAGKIVWASVNAKIHEYNFKEPLCRDYSSPFSSNEAELVKKVQKVWGRDERWKARLILFLLLELVEARRVNVDVISKSGKIWKTLATRTI